MAIKYIKLGPIGDAFSSTELGLYLIPGNASEIDENILINRLSNFSQTGFIVEISKLEYDNIKLTNSLATSSGLNSVPIGQPYILEPVDDVQSTPPESIKGKRYLIPDAVPGIFMGKKDYIAQSDGLDWVYTKPEDGMILPVYAWGISLHYTGTYPSGKWDIPASRLENLQSEADTGQSQIDILTKALNAEVVNREEADKNLQDEINGLGNFENFSGKAADVTVEDVNNYYEGNNVETILKQLGSEYNLTTEALSDLYTRINAIIASGISFKFFPEAIAPDNANGDPGNLYLNTATGVLFQKDIANTWQIIYTFNTVLLPYSNKIPSGTTAPIVLDFTDDALPFKKFGKNAQIQLYEDIDGVTDKPRNDIYYERAWTTSGRDVLLTITINPTVDGTGKTIDNLNYEIRR